MILNKANIVVVVASAAGVAVVADIDDTQHVVIGGSR